MKLIEVTCPKCKAIMKVDKANKEMNCEFCGNKILIDDEVKKVKILGVGEISEEQEFKNALANLKFKEYDKAYRTYKSLSERYTDNKEVWIGMLRAITKDFTNEEYDPLYETYYDKYKNLVDEKELSKYKSKYENYISKFSDKDKKNAIKKQKREKNKEMRVFTITGIIVIVIFAIAFGSMIYGIVHEFNEQNSKTEEKYKTKEEYQTEINDLQVKIDEEYKILKSEYDKLKEEVKPTRDKINDLELKQHNEFMKNGFSKKYNAYENDIKELKDSISGKESEISSYKLCLDSVFCSSGRSSSMKKYYSLVTKRDKLEREMNEKYN